MQLSVFETIQDVDYSEGKTMIGLSGGINSAAVLVYLAEYVESKPDEIYLYYSHLKEHSSDTERFVLDLVEYAKKHFKKVIFESSINSMLEYCEYEFKGIPQPAITPCTKMLKLVHMTEFMYKHGITRDIVGYIRSEYKRINRQIGKGVKSKDYLIRHLSDEDCFSLVEKYFGWYPEIYKIKWSDPLIGIYLEKFGHELHPIQRRTIAKYHKKGYNNMRKSYRVFKHNNCLPCKNMHQWELFLVRIFFQKEYEKAIETATKLNSYWGRSSESVNENSDCAICSI